MRRGAWVLVWATVALVVSGCGDAVRLAARYRAEQMIHQAERAEREARLGQARPDSATLLRLRENFLAVRQAIPPPYRRPSDAPGALVPLTLLGAVGKAELHGVRLALQAGRPDLALEQAEWLSAHAEGDILTRRKADFAAMGALRQMGRYDDAIAQMHSMLERYKLFTPRAGGEEDALLSVPELMVNTRREQGDEAGAAKELEYTIAYYQKTLREPNPPALEAQVRSLLIRTYLEQGNATAALAELTGLDKLIASNPEFKTLEPEVHYSRARIRSLVDKTPDEAIHLLDRVAADYPTSPYGARALLESAVLNERHKRFEAALDRYHAVISLYPGDQRVAPMALFRQGMLEEQAGKWDDAKRTLESIPVKYPASKAAAEAPITIALRYASRNDKPAALAALSRAVLTYDELIARDSTSAFTTLYRWNKLRCQLPLGKWQDGLKTVDEMLVKDKGHPYTAQALIEAARIAKSHGQPDRGAVYLQRYLEDYPNSPLADRVRKEREAMLH
jgi:outer membrane protein assembly factor BamD (BamD/ComL family)